MTNSNLLRCHTLWIGTELPKLQACCLESFVQQGHEVVLYSYHKMEVPSGVAVRDASLILPYQPVGSLAIFSDWFRYELLARIDGIWIDTDLVCIRPIQIADPYIFGYETEGQINGAVLGLPQQSKILSILRGLFPGRGFIPPWFSSTRRFRYRVKRVLGIHKGVSTLQHGSTGPRALTWYARSEGVLDKAQPTDVFYPYSYLQVMRAFDPTFDVLSVITQRTLCIHLWQHAMASAEIHPKSLIGRVLARDFKAITR